MLKKNFVIGLGLALLLTACTEPNTPTPGIQTASSAASSAISSDASSAETVLEYGDSEAAGASSAASVHEIFASERFLSNGVLELGNTDAKITVTLFTHHSCSYCRTFMEEELPRLITDFVEKGNVKLQIVPLELRKYPQSTMQEKYFVCGAMQSKGLELHQLLFTANVMDKKAEATIGKLLKLDAKALTACLKDPQTEAIIKAQQEIATSQNITLVPTFIINGKTLVGLRGYADLRGEIETTLAK